MDVERARGDLMSAAPGLRRDEADAVLAEIREVVKTPFSEAPKDGVPVKDRGGRFRYHAARGGEQAIHADAPDPNDVSDAETAVRFVTSLGSTAP